MSRPRRWLRWGTIALAFLTLLVVGSWLAIPLIARAQIEKQLAAALARPVTVGRVEFNPFKLVLRVEKLAVDDPPRDAPLVAFDELIANVSSASVWKRAVVLDALKVVRPSVSLARDRSGRLSVQDLIDSFAAAPPGPMPRFSVNNIEIEQGSVAFDDGPKGRQHRITAVDAGIPFVSTLPHDVEVRVVPRLSGVLNGSHFEFAGATLPFAERREASLDVALDDLPLREYVAYLPARPTLDIAAGRLTSRLKIVFIDAKSGERRLELRGDARVDGFAVRRRDGGPLAAAERIAVRLDRVEPLAQEASIGAIALTAPTVELKRNADGALELAQPLFETAARSSGTAREGPSAWSVSLAKLEATRGALALVDESTGFRSDLVDVALEATNLSTRKGERAKVKASFVTADRIASFEGEGDVDLAGPAATGRFAFTKFSLALLLPYYKSALAVDVQKGSLDYATGFSVDAEGRLRLAGGEATVRDLRVVMPGNRNPLYRAPQLVVRGIDVDVPARSIVLDEATGRGVALRIVRERDGTLEMSRMLRTAAGGGAANAPVGGAAVTAAASVHGGEPWVVLAKKLVVDRGSVDAEDRVPEPAVRLVFRDVRFEASDVSNRHGAKARVALRTRVGERGRLAYAGLLATRPLALAGQLEASDLPLLAAKPYLEPHVNVVLADGSLAAKGRIAIEVREGAAPRASWQGNVAISDFAALDKPTSSDLARWKSLVLDGADVTSDPFRADIASLRLADFFARVIVYSDATLNLARLLTPGASPEPAPGAKPERGPGASGGGPALPRSPVSIAIGRIELARGNINFSDFFVQPNYSANLTDVAGSVSAMRADQAGDVAIAARVDRTAPVEIDGRINPFARELALDLRGKARDVDLPPLTPYSAKYAGYGIDKGKLSFDVRYRIENRKLSAENRLVLDQLTFGARVDSPTATKLPVLLAVALLKDARGVIDVRLPISGSLDDPKFSVGGLIIQVIVNLIAKAATAPFALLGAAFGGGEELSTLEFTAGTAAIAGSARQRIDTLGKALADRPGLKVDIAGRADPASDREALRHAAVDTALRQAKMKALAAAGRAPASLDQVAIGAEERNRWLTAAYREAPLPERPRNALGLLQDVPPAEMEAMLYRNAKVDDDALRALANARAQAVKDAIAATGIAGERLFLVAPRLGNEATGGSEGARRATAPATATRVDLALR